MVALFGSRTNQTNSNLFLVSELARTGNINIQADIYRMTLYIIRNLSKLVQSGPVEDALVANHWAYLFVYSTDAESY